MHENNSKDPAIRLFGKKIPLNSDGDLPPISDEDLASSEKVEEVENEEKSEKVPISSVRDFFVGRYMECVIWGSEEYLFGINLEELMGWLYSFSFLI